MVMAIYLAVVMAIYGIIIVTALVTEMSPDFKVRNSMNEINAEDEKIIKVKSAESGPSEKSHHDGSQVSYFFRS